MCQKHQRDPVQPQTERFAGPLPTGDAINNVKLATSGCGRSPTGTVPRKSVSADWFFYHFFFRRVTAHTPAPLYLSKQFAGPVRTGDTINNVKRATSSCGRLQTGTVPRKSVRQAARTDVFNTFLTSQSYCAHARPLYLSKQFAGPVRTGDAINNVKLATSSCGRLPTGTVPRKSVLREGSADWCF